MIIKIINILQRNRNFNQHMHVASNIAAGKSLYLASNIAAGKSLYLASNIAAGKSLYIHAPT
jgi:hypothetical protein